MLSHLHFRFRVTVLGQIYLSQFVTLNILSTVGGEESGMPVFVRTSFGDELRFPAWGCLFETTVSTRESIELVIINL